MRLNICNAKSDDGSTIAEKSQFLSEMQNWLGHKRAGMSR